MATIRKRKSSYQISVSCGYDAKGKQICRYLTYTPEKGRTPRQIEKEVQRQAVLFEEACRNGLAPTTGKIKLSEFIDMFFTDYAVTTLKSTTVVGYSAMVPRVNAALGHMRLDRIQPHHLNTFYKNLAEKGVRKKVRYIPKIDLKAKAKEKGFTATSMGRDFQISASTVRTAFKGEGVYERTAEELCKALGLNISKAFTKQGEDGTLSVNTIKHYHMFLSTVLSLAVKWQIIPSNPCARATLPKSEKKSAKYLDEVEAKKLLERLEKEDMQHKTMIKLLMYLKWETIYRYKLQGMRINYRGESLYLFDLSAKEAFLPQSRDPETGKIKRPKPILPREWLETFGMSVDEHQASTQVDLDNGFASSDITAKPDTPDTNNISNTTEVTQ